MKKTDVYKEQELIPGQRLKIIDPETGGSSMAIFGGRRPYVMKEQWSTITHTGREEMAQLADIFNPAARLMYWCEAHLTFGGNLHNPADGSRVTWANAASDLRMDKAQVSRTVKKLEAAGLLLADKSRKHWIVHPKVAHYGSLKTLGKKRAEANVIYAEFDAGKRRASIIAEIRGAVASGLNYEDALYINTRCNDDDLFDIRRELDPEFEPQPPNPIFEALVRAARARVDAGERPDDVAVDLGRAEGEWLIQDIFCAITLGG